MSTLEISYGVSSQTGPKPHNEDAFGVATPAGEERRQKGLLLAVADGVSGSDFGREASRTTIRCLLGDYYATPATWEVSSALDRVLHAQNRWLRARQSRQGVWATTLSAMVLKGCRYTLAQVGDSRIYRLRQGLLQQLTQDHVWESPGMQHVLRRAVGLDEHIQVDYWEGELQVGDRFLLLTDGVWEPLGDKRLHELLHLHLNPERAAQACVDTALQAGGGDNATAMVVQIEALPPPDAQDTLALAQGLDVPPKLRVGQVLDEWTVLALLHESRGSLLYQVEGRGRLWVLKTLPPLLRDDATAQQRLLLEEWLAKRVTAHYFAQVLPLAVEERSALYYLMSWHEGETLEQRMQREKQGLWAEGVNLGLRLLKAVSVLHRLNIIHRDIKPANVHLGRDGKLRLLDLGVAYCPGVLDDEAGNPGTPSFMAPELLTGAPATVASDLYAVGVTLYTMFTGRYPYGEIEPFQNPRFGEPVPASRYRPDMPEWLEAVLYRAVQRDPQRRFETAEEFLLALERGERQQQTLERMPLLARNPSLVWAWVAVISLLCNLVLAYLFLVRYAG